VILLIGQLFVLHNKTAKSQLLLLVWIAFIGMRQNI